MPKANRDRNKESRENKTNRSIHANYDQLCYDPNSNQLAIAEKNNLSRRNTSTAITGGGNSDWKVRRNTSKATTGGGNSDWKVR
jgi:hypothetical protein